MRLIIPFIIFALIIGAASAYAQGGVTSADVDRQMRSITDRLNCPLCQGQTLTECPLQVCDEMRALIRQKLLAGENEAQIRAYFVDRFGDRVLNEPPREGFALLGWVMPVVGLVVGVVVVTLMLRGMTQRQTPALAAQASQTPASKPPAPPDLPTEYVERLERELRQRE